VALLVLVSSAPLARADRTPTERRNLELYQRLIAAENSGDFDALGGLFSPEFRSVVNGRPVEGQGPSIEVETLRATRQAFRDYVATVDHVLADGDHLAAGWRVTGIHGGRHPQIPLPPTDRPVDFSGCTMLEIEEGRIVRALNYIDVSAVMRQLGVTGLIGMLAYLAGGVIALVLAGVAVLAHRLVARSLPGGRGRLMLGLALGAAAAVAFLALSFRLREILETLG
jgi:predicted ester cyclase